MEKNKKIYILDTNVLLHDPHAIYSFESAHIGIPIFVLEELDHFKQESTQRGYHSREVARHLDELRERGSLRDGVKLENGAVVQVLFLTGDEATCTLPLDPEEFDNKILGIAYCMKQKGYAVRFITKDINARVKADVLGIEAEDYFKDTVSKEHVYRGWIKLEVPAVQLKQEYPGELNEIKDLVLNQFVLLESQHNPENYVLFRYLGSSKFKRVDRIAMQWPFEHRNPQQLMALDLLFDTSIQIITLIGPAGTGKTFLAILAGLHQVLIEQEYERILISRPVIPLGPDIGYLPGDIQEKLHSWMQPVHDNMQLIIHAANTAAPVGVYKENGMLRPGISKYKKRRRRRDAVIPSLDDLIKEDKISLEAITYMRGRSIPYQFIIIDEVQNLTPHEVKTLVTRVGEGSKIILAGDPYQIDSPLLDFGSNGLTVSTSKFMGQRIFGTVFLETSERSELSRLAGELL